MNYALEVEKLSFAYRKQLVLKEISFFIEKGQ